jgi:hypothetical protein
VANYNRIFWEPHLSLFQLKRVLSKSFKTVIIQNNSIRIPLNLLDLSIIPAIIEEGSLKIPDRDAHNWVPSNVHRHIQLTTAMNESKKYLYKPLVKSLKCWRDQRLTEAWRPKFFLLECLVYDYAANSTLDSIPKAIKNHKRLHLLSEKSAQKKIIWQKVGLILISATLWMRFTSLGF